MEKPEEVQLDVTRQIEAVLGVTTENPEQVQLDVTRQINAALAIGIAGLLLGLAIAMFWSAVPGLLVAILGLLLGAFLKLDAFLTVITTNQCTNLDLQKEVIRELRKVSSSKSEIGQ